MHPSATTRIPPAQWLLLGFLAFSVLWKGGKSLETTWLLVAIAGVLTLSSFLTLGKNEHGRWEIHRHRPLTVDLPLSTFHMLVWAAGISFFLWTVLSYVLSTTANYGLDEVLRDCASILLFFWIMRQSQEDRDGIFLRRFLACVTVVTLLACFMGFLVYFLQPVNRFVGTFFDSRFHTDYWPNAWAEYLLLAWPLVFLWLVKIEKSERSGRSLLGLLGIGIVFGCLLLSYSRGALLAFAIQLVALRAFHVLEHGPLVASTGPRFTWKSLVYVQGANAAGIRRMWTRFGLIAVFALLTFVGSNTVRSSYYPVQSVTEKVTFTADEGTSSVSERQQFWNQSFSLIRERPLFGWGPYSFRFVQQRLQTGVLQTSDHPHNVLLKLAAERGIIASLLFILLVGAVLLRTGVLFCTKWFKTRMGETVPLGFSHKTLGFLLIALLGVLAHNMIDYNLQFVGIAFPFWMALGMLAGIGATASGPSFNLNNKFVHYIELCIGIFLLLVALREGIYLVTSSFGRHAEAKGHALVALQWYDRSKGEWFSRDLHLSRAMLVHAHPEVTVERLPVMDYLEDNAQDPRGWKVLGDTTALFDRAGAKVSYEQALRLGQWNDIGIALALAQVLWAEKDPTSALGAYRDTFDQLLTAFADAIAVNAHFAALSHNVEDAIALAAILAQEFPDDAPRYEVLAARIDRASKNERAKILARPPGYLW